MVPLVFCDDVYMCTETSRVTTVILCYVRKLFVLPQFLWLCGQDTDGYTSIMGVSNPGYREYTIYGETINHTLIFLMYTC